MTFFVLVTFYFFFFSLNPSRFVFFAAVKKFFATRYPYFPIIGLVLYVVMFAYTTTLYPGGSVNHPNMLGHSFFHNFLCDMNGKIAINGMANPANAMSMLSHIVLSFTMITFFYALPEIFDRKNTNTQLVRWFGVLTMSVFILMFTTYHDLIVILTAILGTVALIPFFIELLHYSNKPLKLWAYLCYIMSVIVFIIFVTKFGFYYLPFLQKITFVIDAVWVVWVCLIVSGKFKRKRKQVSEVV